MRLNEGIPMKKSSGYLLSLLLPAALLLLWWALTREGGVPPLLLPAPERVAERAWRLLASGELPRHAAASMARVFTGFLLSAAAALALALLIHRLPRTGDFLSLVLNALRVIPPLSLVPLLILWLGIDEAPKIAIVVLASFFPVHLSALSALRNVSDAYRELAAVFRLSERQVVRHILLPGAAPGILTGLRLGFGYAWRALVGAELIAAASGLGYLIEDASLLARTDVVVVGILTIALLGILCDALFGRIAASLARSRPSSRRRPEEEPDLPAACSRTVSFGAGVRVEDLSVTYAGASAPVLSGLSLELVPRGVTAVLGRSGCGKTTLLRAVAGLLPEGAAVAGGVAFVRPDGTLLRSPRIAMVFQDPTLLPWKTVAENVSLAFLQEGAVPDPRSDPRIRGVLRLVGLEDLADAMPAALSGGQRQRVGVARALAADPEVLLMDEPFGALDALTRRDLQDECIRVFAECDMTVLMITHDVREAVRMADRTVLLANGGVEASFDVTLPRPRRISDPDTARLEETLLEVLMRPQAVQA